MNRFDVYNNDFPEFRYLYYLMLWLVGDQFLPEDVLRVIGEAERQNGAGYNLQQGECARF
ncbi:hypothetical protein FML34_28500 [Klebsiella grimontii]|nr:hypothetical protein [Klebsiella grimontii]